MVGILYYTDGLMEGTHLGELSKQTIKASGLPITSVSLKRPIDFGKNIFIKGARSHSMLYEQILTGLRIMKEDYVFFCEHDVLYHPSHFDFRPERNDIYYYNENVYKFRISDKKIITYDCSWLSQLCANRLLLIKHYTKRLRMIRNGERAYGYEPGTGQSRRIDKYKSANFSSKYPNIDVRHGDNWTGVNRMKLEEFKTQPKNWKELNINNVPDWDTKLLLSL